MLKCGHDDADGAGHVRRTDHQVETQIPIVAREVQAIGIVPVKSACTEAENCCHHEAEEDGREGRIHDNATVYRVSELLTQIDRDVWR